MRLTVAKKTILSYYEPEEREWVTREIGPPPFDVTGLAYLLKGMGGSRKKSHVESTRRTLEAMVSDGLLEKVTVYERRQDRSQYSGDAAGVWCMVSRYGLPGECTVTLASDTDIGREAIPGEYVRID